MSDESRLTDERIVTSRRDALRRIGQAAVVVAFGGLAGCAKGDDAQVATTTTSPDIAGATLRRPEYSGSGASGADTDVSRTADPKGDSDVTNIADPTLSTDFDTTIFADPVGSGTDSDCCDPIGTGTDTDYTINGDPKGDGDITYYADVKGDTDITRVADPVGPRS